MNSGKKGVYVHIPFCRSKCPYCDFYSLVNPNDRELFDSYEQTLIREIKSLGEFSANTVYFGGGTPSLFSPERIDRILSALAPNIDSDSEITIECNPKTVSLDSLRGYKSAGVNRLSVGVQSFDKNELAALGRIHSPDDAARAVTDAFCAGFENVSLDLMIATPGQTVQSLKDSIDRAVSLGVKHLSAYILTIEPNTVFGKKGVTLPDDDTVAQMYIGLANRLKANGIEQYEISNFAKKGFESRHNIKYWNCEEYYGIGASAHSFVGSHRYCHERDVAQYISSGGRIYLTTDDAAGKMDEYIMLRLRLLKGLSLNSAYARYKHENEKDVEKKLRLLYNRAKQLESTGFVKVCGDVVALTQTGCLVSNSVIAELLCL